MLEKLALRKIKQLPPLPDNRTFIELFNIRHLEKLHAENSCPILAARRLSKLKERLQKFTRSPPIAESKTSIKYAIIKSHFKQNAGKRIVEGKNFSRNKS
jgi:hypothetical protein